MSSCRCRRCHPPPIHIGPVLALFSRRFRLLPHCVLTPDENDASLLVSCHFAISGHFMTRRRHRRILPLNTDLIHDSVIQSLLLLLLPPHRYEKFATRISYRWSNNTRSKKSQLIRMELNSSASFLLRRANEVGYQNYYRFLKVTGQQKATKTLALEGYASINYRTILTCCPHSQNITLILSYPLDNLPAPPFYPASSSPSHSLPLYFSSSEKVTTPSTSSTPFHRSPSPE